jgi:hypothetical protein
MKMTGGNKDRHWHSWQPNDNNTSTEKKCECGAIKRGNSKKWVIAKRSKRNYLSDAMSISELYGNFEAITADDGLKFEDYPVEQYVAEAKWILDCINESGHILNDMLHGVYTKEEKRDVISQRGKLQRYVKRYIGICDQTKMGAFGCVKPEVIKNN